MRRGSRPTESKTIDFYGIGFDEMDGVVEAITAVTGVVDRAKPIRERIHGGAFAKTLSDHRENFAKLPMGIDHEYGAGVTLDMQEVGRGDLPVDIRRDYPEATGGLYCKGQTVMSDTNIALLRRLNTRMKAGDAIGSSFVYEVFRDGRSNDALGPVRDLYELSVNEWTIAVRKAPVNKAARVLGVKATGDEIDAKSEQLEGSDEAKQAAIMSAVRLSGLVPVDGWGYIRGTFPTHVIVSLSGPDIPEAHYRIEYAVLGDGVALGAVTPVELELTVAEKAVAAGELMGIVNRLTAEAKAGRVLRQELADELDGALQKLQRIWNSVKSSTAGTSGTASDPDGDAPAAKAVEAADDEDMDLEALGVELALLESRAAIAAIGG